jgi:hypothetical protein
MKLTIKGDPPQLHHKNTEVGYGTLKLRDFLGMYNPVRADHATVQLDGQSLPSFHSSPWQPKNKLDLQAPRHTNANSIPQMFHKGMHSMSKQAAGVQRAL